MRGLLVILTLALVACGQPKGTKQERVGSPRVEPSNTTPGLHISGHVNVGVVRRF
jgi:hypothetical protein